MPRLSLAAGTPRLMKASMASLLLYSFWSPVDGSLGESNSADW